jgi:hypothetical protein
VSDLHGCAKGLLQAVEYCRELLDMDSAGCRVIFMGDYVDRGCATLFMIIALLLWYGPRITLLRGNHEDLYTHTGRGLLSEFQRMVGASASRSLPYSSAGP